MKTNSQINVYDFAIIGAGMGGLGLGSLLSDNKKVLVFDSHYYSGGCASYFKRKEGFYDVGATTLSGLLKNRPIDRLIQKTRLNIKTIKQEIGITSYHPDLTFHFYSDLDKLKNEFKEKLELDINVFLDEIISLESQLWDLLSSLHSFPIPSLQTILLSKKIAPFHKFFYKSFFECLPTKVRSNKVAIEIIDQVLLISTGQTTRECPGFMGVMGFLYPLDTHAIEGGMRSLCLALEKIIKDNDSKIQLNTRVIEVKKDKDLYIIQTSKGVFYAREVAFNCSPEVTASLLNSVSNKKGNKKGNKKNSNKLETWGAMSAYFSIQLNNVQHVLHHFNTNLYHQVILTQKEKEIFNTDSLFFSFSFNTNKGLKQVSVSTHIQKEKFSNLNQKKEDYQKIKDQFETLVKTILETRLSHLKINNVIFDSVATPLTWRDYTSRPKGEVGGLIHRNLLSLLRLKPNFDRITQTYHVGDYSFPGQGICSVIQSALNVKRIVEK